MDFNPYMNLNFLDLLQSQQDTSINLESSHVPLFGSQETEASNFKPDSHAESRGRRTWTPTDENVLISAWLNTSKDHVVGNEQRSVAFCKRIATYYSASPKIAECDRRESSQCKQRWHKINDLVGKFCGAFEAATREKISGQNKNDVLKHAHEIFFNNYKKKFTIEHAWKELRHDQKWSDLSSACSQGNSKRQKLDNGLHSACSLADDGTTQPPSVKAAKARGKKQVGDGKELDEFQKMWRIKQEDLVIKEKLSKMKLLDRIMAKQEPLDADEEALKKKMLAGQSFGFGVLPSTEESHGVDTEMSGSVKWSKLYVSLCVCVY
ncbi:PREDICTED: glutathione S-transferase T3-like [Brassica oleracea var. oleracea]|uniref:glutathione S-transferase T3-like n=1 Tax=Brassica oleracea var. oleracea TaxID=109376 RepID=UPI0006A6E1CE|nr:PREDICTED: glutathione S-transferase T3-like [Brassica oleracea var. oleracea]